MYQRVVWMRLLSGFVILSALALIVVLHVVLLFHAGALWRDEANSAEFAAMPFLSSIASSLRFDNFPPGFTLILRAWPVVAASDFGMRIFGLIVGMGVVAALWFSTRMLGAGAPLLGLALFGLNATSIVYGDSIRPYGIGTVFVVLTAGLVWRAASTNSPRVLGAALLTAVLSVQFLYQNAVFLFAICTAGAVATIRLKNWRGTISILGIGMISLLSLLPYLGAIHRNQDWTIIWSAPMDFSHLLDVLLEALGGPWSVPAAIWIAVIAIGIPVAFRKFISEPRSERNGVVLFCAITLLLSVAGLVALIEYLSVPSQPWYYLQLMALGAVCLDGICAFLSRHWAVQLMRLVAVPVVIGTAGLSLWEAVHVRATDMDVIASELEKKGPDDFIILNPWYLGVSFHRLYHGATPWMTVPPMEDLRIHRYDLLKQAMTLEEPLAPLLASVQKSLSSGKRVWLIGDLILPPAGETVQKLPAAPNGPDGWDSGPYIYEWAVQVGQFLRLHARRSEQVALPMKGPVSNLENPFLFMFEGWIP